MAKMELNDIILKKIDPDKYRFIITCLKDSEAMDWLGLSNASDLESERNKLVKGFTTFNKDFIFFYIYKTGYPKAIGWCGYHTWYTSHNRAEIGYVLFDESNRGKGIMKSVLKEVIRYGFDEMKLHRIEAMVAPGNTPSINLLTSNNFKEEGLLREHYLVNGVHEDSKVYSLLKHEYLV